MYLVTEYQFERNIETPILYRFRYYQAKAPSLHLIVRRWRPWSTWLTIKQIQKIVKERHKFSELVSGLREMKPGTTRTKRHVEEKAQRDLYLWNTPSTILSKRNSRLVRATYVSVISSGVEAAKQVASSLSSLGETEWYSRVSLLLSKLGLDEEKKQAVQQAREQEQLSEFVRTQLVSELQSFVDKRRVAGEILSNKTDLKEVERGRFLVNNKYNTDIQNMTCTCSDFLEMLQYFDLQCKHLYACILRKEKSN